MKRLRALPTLLRVGFSEAVAYRAEFLVWVLTTNTPLIMLLVWSSVAREEPLAGRMGEQELGAYFLAALIVRLLTGSWVVWDLLYEIRQGEIAMRLLRPIHPFVAYAAENVAAIPLRALMALPIASAALFWLGSDQLSSDPLNWIFLPLSIAGAWLLTFFTMAAIGSLGFLWESTLSVYQLWLGLYFVLSGYTVPLELFPAVLGALIEWLPFRFLLSFPVEVMLGLIEREEMLTAFSVQWIYVLASAFLAQFIWRVGLRRYAAYGG